MGATWFLTSTIANTSLSAYQSMQQAATQRAQAELDANTLDAQAARKELEADEALAIGQLKIAEQQIAGRQKIAGQRTEYAASGVKVDQGTTAAVQADTAAWNEYERQKLDYEANLQSWGLRYDAALMRQQAANTRAAGVSSTTSAAIAGLTGATSMVNQLWNK